MKNDKCKEIEAKVTKNRVLYKGIKFYKKSIRIDPDNPDAYYGLGFVYAKLGRHKEAIEHYKQTIHIEPYYPKAYSDLGLMYLHWLMKWFGRFLKNAMLVI